MDEIYLFPFIKESTEVKITASIAESSPRLRTGIRRSISTQAKTYALNHHESLDRTKSNNIYLSTRNPMKPAAHPGLHIPTQDVAFE